MPKYTLIDEISVAKEMDAERQPGDGSISNVEATKLAALKGWYCRWDGSSWLQCEKDHPDARLDLHRAADVLFEAQQAASQA